MIELNEDTITNRLYLVYEYLNRADYFRKRIYDELRIIKNELKLKCYMIDLLEGLKYLH